MENFDLIVDNLSPSRSKVGIRTTRFRYGVTMDVFQTLSRDLSNYDIKIHPLLRISRMTCCSAVKNTPYNWLYLTPDTWDSNLAYRWIKEISPIFPELDIAILEVNSKIIDSGIYHSTEPKQIPVIRALYSKKGYPAQAYIAHHLIRACFSEDTIPFIHQYFRIKDKTPDLYFWNRIFLCQFGIKMYYYYWLTDRRTFRFINKKEFEKEAYNHVNTSSLDFFEHFKKDIPNYQKKVLQAQYTNEDFDLFVRNMSLDLIVTPTDKYKRRCHNFDFYPQYRVDLETDTEYIIVADDFRQRKYKKTNFNIIKR